MVKHLPGEEIELVLAEYDKQPLADVYDTANKQEQRGNTGLALKLYEYALERFEPTPKDPPYERAMGSEMYTAVGRLRFLKEEYVRAEVALCKASELNSGNMEAWYWTGEVCYANGFVPNAKTLLSMVLEKSSDIRLHDKARKRLAEMEFCEQEGKRIIN